jgi:hypothetical protein
MRTVWESSVSGLVMASFLVGCGGHLTLQAPAANAPEEERVRAYARLRPVDRSVSRESVVSPDQGKRNRTSHRTNFIVLGNGQKVEHVEDLLPVVPADSDMANDARASVSLDRLGTIAIVVGIAAAGATGVLFLVSEDEYPGPLTFGGAAASGLVIGIGFGARVQSGHRASRAFTAYDFALRRHLDLCDTRGVLATCKHLPPLVP